MLRAMFTVFSGRIRQDTIASRRVLSAISGWRQRRKRKHWNDEGRILPWPPARTASVDYGLVGSTFADVCAIGVHDVETGII